MKVVNILLFVILINVLVSSVYSVSPVNINDQKSIDTYDFDDLESLLNDPEFIQQWADIYTDEMFIHDLELQSAKEFKDFAIGFAEGLEISLSKDSEKCFSEVRTSLKDFETAFKLIGEGFQRKSLGSLTVGIQDLGIALQEIVHAFDVCKVPKLIDEIRAISDELSSGKTGIIKLIIKESIIIFRNHRDLTADFRSGVATWKAREFRPCGRSVGHIVGILIE